MLKLKGIKKYFKDEEKYLDFLDTVDNIWRDYTTEYAFLGIKEESWITLFNNIVIVCLRDKKPDKISNMVRKKVLEHLDKQLKKKNYKIIINILIILNNQGLRKKELLQAFFRRLEVLNISMDEDFYEMVKKQPSLLQKTLKFMGVFDMRLKEIKSYINKKDNVYDLFLTSGRTYEQTQLKVDYILSCMPDKEKFKQELLKKQNNVYLGVVKCIINNYETIILIYDLFKEKVGDVDLKLFVKTIILKYTEKELGLLFEQFRYGKNLDYLYILANRIGYNNIKVVSKVDNKKKNVERVVFLQTPNSSNVDVIHNKSNLPKSPKPEIEEKVVDKSSDLLSRENEDKQQMVIDESDKVLKDGDKSQDVSKDTGEYNVKRKRVRKRLYERFPLKDDIDEDTRKQIVDILLSRRSKKNQDLVRRFIAGEDLSAKDKNTFYRVMFYMQDFYRKNGKNILNSSKVRKNLYERFPLKDDIDEDTRKQIVDFLLNRRSKEIQDLVKRYIAGEKISEEDRKKVHSAISGMREIYKRKGKSILNPFKARKNLYARFPLKDDIDEDMRKQIVDALLNRRSKEIQDLVKRYIAGEDVSEKDKNRFYRTISLMQGIYRKKGTTILKPVKRRKSLYARFPLKDDIDEDTRKQIVDILFGRRSKDDQDLIKRYIAGEDLSNKEIKKVRCIIAKMQDNYRRNGRNILNPSKARKGLYERFPLKDDIDENTRKQIVDILLSRRKKGKQDLINRYFADEDLSEQETKIVLNSIIGMQALYRKHGKNVFSEYKQEYFLRIVKSIQNEFGIIIEDVSLEKKDILYDALRVIEYVYRNNLGMIKEDYDSYMIERMLELFCNNGCRTLEDLVVLFVNNEYRVINETRKSRE